MTATSAKSELRTMLEQALGERAAPDEHGEIRFTIDTWQVESRWAGTVWWQDRDGKNCRVVIFGKKTGESLGRALLAAVEAF